MGPTALFPVRRKACWGLLSPLKIRRLRWGLNPRTWVLKANTLPLDHRSRLGHILRRNCLLKHVIEGKIKGEMEVTRTRWRRRRKLLDDIKDRTGYCHLKEEALDCTMWRNRFGGGFEPIVRQNTEWWHNKTKCDSTHVFFFTNFCKNNNVRSGAVYFTLHSHAIFCTVIFNFILPLAYTVSDF